MIGFRAFPVWLDNLGRVKPPAMKRPFRHEPLPCLPLRMAALLCVLLVLMLDVLAAAPQWHEAVCHHNRDLCNHPGHGDSHNTQGHSHDGNSCDGCVVTQFAAGHVSGFAPEPLLPVAKKNLVGVLYIRIPVEIACGRVFHLWPQPCAPPAVTTHHTVRGLGRAA